MVSVNKDTLIGNCGRGLEIRYMQDGKAVANVSKQVEPNWYCLT